MRVDLVILESWAFLGGLGLPSFGAGKLGDAIVWNLDRSGIGGRPISVA